MFYWWVIQLLIIRNRINVFIEALSNVMQSLLNACSNLLGVRGLAHLPIAYSGPAHGSPIARSGPAWVPPIAPSGLAWGPPTPYCPFEPWQGPAHCPLPIRTQLVSHLTSYIMLCHIMFDILYQRPLYIIYLILHVTYIICAFMCNPVSLATCFRVSDGFQDVDQAIRHDVFVFVFEQLGGAQVLRLRTDDGLFASRHNS